MPTVDVLDLNNKKVGELELADAVFGAEVNEALLYEAVRHYLAGKRGGNAKTKTRHEVAGSGKKLWKQKGTGRARTGSVRSPLWRHGGTVHGPVTRDYSYSLPRKMQLGALRSALSAKLRDGDLLVVSAFQLASPKTKDMVATLKKFDAAKKELLVGLLGNNLPSLDLVENLMAMWGLRATRECAWTNSELLWHAQSVPGLEARMLDGLDDTAELAGRGLLAPVGV